MIARPFAPGNAHPAEEVARERIDSTRPCIGSCTNGSYDDLLSGGPGAAGGRRQGLSESRLRVHRLPGLAAR